MRGRDRDLVTGKFPKALKTRAKGLGLTEKDCLFAVRSDLTLDATPHDVWLIVTATHAIAVDPKGRDRNAIKGPFALSEVSATRTFQTVGSAFLQFQMGDLYVDVVRYSNALRERFGRVRTEIENLANGREVDYDALTGESRQICETCGLPFPSLGAGCPRCTRQRGVFLRSVGLMVAYWRYIMLLFGLMLIGVGIGLIPPQLQRILVDEVLTTGRNRHWLGWILLGLLSAAGARTVVNIFVGRMSTHIGTRITKELRERLQRKFLTLGVDYYDRHATGQLMSRVLHDVDFFQQFVEQVARGFLLNSMLVVGVGAVLFAMNWRLAFLVMLPIPLVVVGTLSFYRFIYPRYYGRSDSRAKMSRLLNGLLSGIRLVKAFGQETRECKRFSEAAIYMRDTQRGVEMNVATFNPVMAFVFNLGGLLIWYAGGELVMGRQMTLGTLLAFATYLSMFYQPITMMTVFSNWVTSFLAAGQRVFEVLDASPSLKHTANPVRLERMEGAVEFRNVTFGYDPYNPVLRHVSLTIEPGQFIGIVGPSGSGKTTLMNLICRFYDPQRGQVLIDGVNVRDLSLEDLRRQVGLVLQEPFLFRASISENIAYGVPKAGAKAVIEAAHAANAHHFIARRPLAYDTQLGECGAGLSGGERQRISIARALLCDPRILILDEATSSVDTESEQAIQQSLAMVGKGRTTIAIAHRLSTLRNADRIFVVDDGRIAESGTHDELMERQGTYHRLVRIQTELAHVEV